MLLAVDEAVLNAVEHGFSAGAMVEIEMTITPEWATVQVADQGRLGASMPLRLPPPLRPTSSAAAGAC